MFVTVVITNRNYEDMIHSAMISVDVQDYDAKELRLVVVDDGSTDNSLEVIERKASRSRIRVDILQTPVLGPAAARNAGIHHAWEGTDAFAFLDSDDLYGPTKIAESVKHLGPKVGLVYCDETYEDRVAGRKFTRYRKSFDLDRLAKEDIVGANYVVSKAALEKAGLFNESFRTGENYELAARIASNFFLIHVPKVLQHTTLTSRGLRYA